MDILLGKVTQQAMSYAIRSGITISFVRLTADSRDVVEVRFEIQKLGTRLSNAANDEALLRRHSNRAKTREQTDAELKSIISAIKGLLMRIEDAVPLINLAITTSGVNLSTKLSGTISPSRLLQASTFLTAADTKYAAKPGSRCQVGPTYTLSMYMLFAGHVRPTDEAGVRETTWKEVIHKARVKLVRVPLDQLYALPGERITEGLNNDTLPAEAQMAEFAYQLVIIEDMDDDRVHTFEENDPQPGPIDGVVNAGIRDVVPVHEISKIFYADTGKILNIGGDGDTNNPVLLLKRDVHAEPPRRMLHRSQMGEDYRYFDSPLPNGTHHSEDAQSDVDAQLHRESVPSTPTLDRQARPSKWRLPADLDPEWMAFEVFVEEPDSDSDVDDSEPQRPSSSRQPSLDPSLTGALSKLKLSSRSAANSPTTTGQLVPSQLSALQISPSRRPGAPQIKTSLSLLEMLLKLTALQQFRQESHLAIEDELLNFFLEDSSTAGAGPDKDLRQRVRHDALKRVGFDPYDESPIKRRGEHYISHARGAASPRPEYDPRPNFDPEAFPQQFPYDDSYGYDSPLDQQAMPSTEHSNYSDGAAPSSPSPQPPLLLQQTPSRSSTPGLVSERERHRHAVQAKYGAARSDSQVSLLATPPSTTRSRQAVLRAQSEPKPRSPLAREVRAGAKDDGDGKAA